MDNDTDNITLRGCIEGLESHNFTWVDFPCSDEEYREKLKKAGILSWEEVHCPCWESDDLDNVTLHLGYYCANPSEFLDKCAEAIERHGKEAVVAALNAGENVEDLLTHDIIFFPDVCEDRELGEYLLDNEYIEVPDNIRGYFDCEKFGRDVRFEEGGTFTEQGYVALV